MGLNMEQRQTLATFWLRTAQLEHASGSILSSVWSGFDAFRCLSRFIDANEQGSNG